MKPIEILLVEDNAGDVRLMVELLNESGLNHHLSVVSDGMSAIAFVRKLEAYTNAVPPDLMLLDLDLPLKNGLEILEEIKADDKLNHIPILVLSGMEGITADKIALADGIVHKPSNLSEFSHVIKAIHQLGF